MKTKILAIALFMLCALCAFGQTNNTEPQYILTAGLGFNHYDTPQFKGELSFATRVGSGFYNVSTLNTTSKVSTITTGAAKQFYVGQGFTLNAIVDGGVATGNGNVGGVVSGGGILTYDIAKWAKAPGAFVYGAVRVVQTSLGGVQPTFSFGFGKAF